MKIAATFTLAPLTAAEADFADCGGGQVCLWGNNDFKWLTMERSRGKALAQLNGDANNEMDSWANRTARKDARGYDGFGEGDCQTWTRGRSDDNVAPFNSDEVSSTATTGGC